MTLVFVGLTALSMSMSGSIHVAANAIISLCYLNFDILMKFMVPLIFLREYVGAPLFCYDGFIQNPVFPCGNGVSQPLQLSQLEALYVPGSVVLRFFSPPWGPPHA